MTDQPERRDPALRIMRKLAGQPSVTPVPAPSGEQQEPRQGARADKDILTAIALACHWAREDGYVVRRVTDALFAAIDRYAQRVAQQQRDRND